jgi:hypothetical protein
MRYQNSCHRVVAAPRVDACLECRSMTARVVHCSASAFRGRKWRRLTLETG